MTLLLRGLKDVRTYIADNKIPLALREGLLDL